MLAGGLGEEPQRAGREVVVGLKEVVTARIGDDEDLGRASAPA
jgi:hypothetical protein